MHTLRTILLHETHPVEALFTGILVFVLFLAQPSLPLRAVHTGILALMAVLSGKRLKPGYFILFVGGITFFQLLIPRGQVLLELGPFPVTREALLVGLKKGLTLCGLVFLSLFSVRKDLPLPGRLGTYFSRVFGYYAALMSTRDRISLRHPLESLDRILLHTASSLPHSPDAPTTTTPRGRILLGILVLIHTVLTSLGWIIPGI
ncbi:hypothetical protein [Spirochaeta thermophila]|uniref:Cobalt transport protein n=1 Tax=Winmispira thermophila (strain ATCC 49972 / DSM 6192 / RI 19.B1) TaxID=665571 RepID=E0RR27_WINT6|nr:hypothetical protein [Spirochaeta thermophila]ADN01605.1 hypothetical protein STHERM_c06460 [Spirochaeta thermophila DSM 6192]